MKTRSIVLSVVCLFIFNALGFGQKKSETIKVWGNCGMCKKKIETAAVEAGAKTAEWNTETKMLAINFNAKKTSLEKIQQAIAAVGYDTRDVSASEESYNKLHGCCKYDRKEGNTSSSDGKMDCCKNGKCEKPECKNGCTEACKQACKENQCCKS